MPFEPVVPEPYTPLPVLYELPVPVGADVTEALLVATIRTLSEQEPSSHERAAVWLLVVPQAVKLVTSVGVVHPAVV